MASLHINKREFDAHATARRRRRQRSIAIGLGLAALALAFYAAAILRIGGQLAQRAM